MFQGARNSYSSHAHAYTHTHTHACTVHRVGSIPGEISNGSLLLLLSVTYGHLSPGFKGVFRENRAREVHSNSQAVTFVRWCCSQMERVPQSSVALLWQQISSYIYQSPVLKFEMHYASIAPLQLHQSILINLLSKCSFSSHYSCKLSSLQT